MGVVAVARYVSHYGGWDWDPEFDEISRPCLRHTELEVEIVMDAQDEDAWFAAGTSEHALQTIALACDDAYLPEERSLKKPLLIGAGVVLAIASALIAL